MKKAMIIGVTGQDGSYLSDFLLSKNYEVHGIRRRISSENLQNISHLKENYLEPRKSKFFLHYGDVTDSSSIISLITKINPDEIYNMAAQSHVHVSFQVPEYTTNVDALGTLRILEAVRSFNTSIKFYQASTSELYGNSGISPQNEDTPFNPQSPYAIAKQYGYWITKHYRETYGIFAVNGILFNHESPRRGSNFVSRKITLTLSKILDGKVDKLSLGNLNAKRDWGYAKDYVEAMWLMLQQEKPEDYVISTGESHTVREFVDEAFNCAGIKLAWEGKGVDEVGINQENGKILIDIDPYYFRPSEVHELLGDSTKAKVDLGWRPKITFSELVKIMVQADINE